MASTSRIGDETRAIIAAAWLDILARVAAGSLISAALEAHGLSRKDLSTWMIESAPEVRQEWEEARESSADSFADEALSVARDPMVEAIIDASGQPVIIKLDAQHARTRIDTLKWAARIRNPRLYREQTTLDVNVRSVDLTAIIIAANARLAAARASQLIEADVRVVPLLDDLL